MAVQKRQQPQEVPGAQAEAATVPTAQVYRPGAVGQGVRSSSEEAGRSSALLQSLKEAPVASAVASELVKHMAREAGSYLAKAGVHGHTERDLVGEAFGTGQVEVSGRGLEALRAVVGRDLDREEAVRAAAFLHRLESGAEKAWWRTAYAVLDRLGGGVANARDRAKDIGKVGELKREVDRLEKDMGMLEEEMRKRKDDTAEGLLGYLKNRLNKLREKLAEREGELKELEEARDKRALKAAELMLEAEKARTGGGGSLEKLASSFEQLRAKYHEKLGKGEEQKGKVGGQQEAAGASPEEAAARLRGVLARVVSHASELYASTRLRGRDLLVEAVKRAYKEHYKEEVDDAQRAAFEEALRELLGEEALEEAAAQVEDAARLVSRKDVELRWAVERDLGEQLRSMGVPDRVVKATLRNAASTTARGFDEAHISIAGWTAEVAGHAPSKEVRAFSEAVQRAAQMKVQELIKEAGERMLEGAGKAHKTRAVDIEGAWVLPSALASEEFAVLAPEAGARAAERVARAYRGLERLKAEGRITEEDFNRLLGLAAERAARREAAGLLERVKEALDREAGGADLLEKVKGVFGGEAEPTAEVEGGLDAGVYAALSEKLEKGVARLRLEAGQRPVGEAAEDIRGLTDAAVKAVAAYAANHALSRAEGAVLGLGYTHVVSVEREGGKAVVNVDVGYSVAAVGRLADALSHRAQGGGEHAETPGAVATRSSGAVRVVYTSRDAAATDLRALEQAVAELNREVFREREPSGGLADIARAFDRAFELGGLQAGKSLGLVDRGLKNIYRELERWSTWHARNLLGRRWGSEVRALSEYELEHIARYSPEARDYLVARYLREADRAEAVRILSTAIAEATTSLGESLVMAGAAMAEYVPFGAAFARPMAHLSYGMLRVSYALHSAAAALSAQRARERALRMAARVGGNEALARVLQDPSSRPTLGQWIDIMMGRANKGQEAQQAQAQAQVQQAQPRQEEKREEEEKKRQQQGQGSTG